VVKQISKLIQVLTLIGKHSLRIIYKGKHLFQLRLFVNNLIRFLNIRRETSKSSEEHHQVVIKLLFSFWAYDNRKDIISICIEINSIEPTKGCGDLILPAPCLITKDTLQINGFVS